MRSEVTTVSMDSTSGRPEAMAAQEFANSVLVGGVPGFHSDSEIPAMATPATPTAAQFVIQGSTICLVC
ncbi:cypemycin family RiPP [Streptomyces sp. NPDC054784]